MIILLEFKVGGLGSVAFTIPNFFLLLSSLADKSDNKVAFLHLARASSKLPIGTDF